MLLLLNCNASGNKYNLNNLEVSHYLCEIYVYVVVSLQFIDVAVSNCGVR